MLANSDGVGCALGVLDVQKAVQVAVLGLASRSGRHIILRRGEDGAAACDLDARVLAVRKTALERRHLPFRCETDFDKIPDLPPGPLDGCASEFCERV